MARKRAVSDEEALEALADAVTRAIHWAPESLLAHFDGGRREAACRRLALRVVMQLAGDGWAEARGRAGACGLHAAIAAAVGEAGGPLLPTLRHSRGCWRCNGPVLDGLGLHFAAAILAGMKAEGARIRRSDVFRRVRTGHRAAHQSGCSPPL